MIAPGSHVTLHYRLAALIDGAEREVISTQGGRPATLQLGAGQLAEVLEQRLLGLDEGAEASYEIPAGQGFGERNPELVRTITRAAFEAHADPDAQYGAGDVVEFSSAGSALIAGVVQSRDERQVVVDFNHPLAGMPLRFTVQVIGVL